MTDDIKPIKNKLDIDPHFLHQAWRNTRRENLVPLDDLAELCLEKPAYIEYTQSLMNKGFDLDKAMARTETLALSIINLTHNQTLDTHTRKEIARGVILRLNFGLDLGMKRDQDEKMLHHAGSRVDLPESLDAAFHKLFVDTREAGLEYLQAHRPHEIHEYTRPQI